MRYGARIVVGDVIAIAPEQSGFKISMQESGGRVGEMRARFVLLATGVADTHPKLAGVPEAIQRGLLRYCPICDGYEAKGKTIGVIGAGNEGLREAVFIARTYSAAVSILSINKSLRFNREDHRKLVRYGIRVIREPIRCLALDDSHIAAIGARSGAALMFDVIYPALGVQYRSELAAALGASRDEAGALVVGPHCETTVPGLYAAGDVTQGLKQIVVGMGQAAIAATAVHNNLLQGIADRRG
jgi:thioredoxin reductase (NADPH)